MKLAISWLWVYPAFLMTLFTLLTFTVAAALPLGKRVPFGLNLHLQLLVSNPKDDYLYQRPSPLLALGFLVAGCIPLVTAVLLGVHLVIVALYVGAVFSRHQRERGPAPQRMPNSGEK